MRISVTSATEVLPSWLKMLISRSRDGKNNALIRGTHALSGFVHTIEAVASVLEHSVMVA